MPSPRDKKLHLRGKKRQKYLFHIPLSPKLISKDSVRLVGLLGWGGWGGGAVGIFKMVCLYSGDSEQDVGSESPRYFLKGLFPQPL